MDLYNQLILDNKEYITNVYTINNYHRNLLRYNNLENNIYLYQNFVFTQKSIKVPDRSHFKNKICFVGRIAQEKNVQLLVDAFTEFSKRNTNIQLFIIGDGKLKIESNCDNIIFTGNLKEDQISTHLNECDYLIQPSYSEGLPFSIIESMRAIESRFCAYFFCSTLFRKYLKLKPSFLHKAIPK